MVINHTPISPDLGVTANLASLSLRQLKHNFQ